MYFNIYFVYIVKFLVKLRRMEISRIFSYVHRYFLIYFLQVWYDNRIL